MFTDTNITDEDIGKAVREMQQSTLQHVHKETLELLMAAASVHSATRQGKK